MNQLTLSQEYFERIMAIDGKMYEPTKKENEMVFCYNYFLVHKVWELSEALKTASFNFVRYDKKLPDGYGMDKFHEIMDLCKIIEKEIQNPVDAHLDFRSVGEYKSSIYDTKQNLKKIKNKKLLPWYLKDYLKKSKEYLNIIKNLKV